MEDRYYQPTIDEFNVGFEYELVFQTRGEEEIVHQTFNGVINPEDIKYRLNQGIVRVKSLNKTDLELLGFIQQDVKSYYIRTNICGVVDQDRLLYRIIFNNTDYITIEKSSWDLKFHELYIFKGECKNKSELKKILKQTKIC